MLTARLSPHRLFSLQVPLPPTVFLSMVFKFEEPTAVRVALELTTGDAGGCHVGGISVLTGEGAKWPCMTPCPMLGRRQPMGCGEEPV